MIISRTPYRISFCGGGTDFASFYTQEPGYVLSTSIDKYLYVIARRQIGLVEYKYRINYSTVEFCKEIDEIQHPIVREAFKIYNIDFPIEITTFADIPASTGLGSSSAFAVGLLHALSGILGIYKTKYELAQQAAHIEIEILGRTIGKQDHFASSYGDINTFCFESNGDVRVSPVFCRPEVLKSFSDHLMLFYTGIKRNASEVLKTQEEKKSINIDHLRLMKLQVSSLRDILSQGINLSKIGEILHEGWILKKKLSEFVTNEKIEEWYLNAMNAGAIGGKLLGAGGGGFLLIYGEPQNHSQIKKALAELFYVPFRFETIGSRIDYFSRPSY
jgi:D-glycero-alpha-D-manno-heptose-7-phosphate kinase